MWDDDDDAPKLLAIVLITVVVTFALMPGLVFIHHVITEQEQVE